MPGGLRPVWGKGKFTLSQRGGRRERNRDRDGEGVEGREKEHRLVYGM